MAKKTKTKVGWGVWVLLFGIPVFIGLVLYNSGTAKDLFFRSPGSGNDTERWELKADVSRQTFGDFSESFGDRMHRGIRLTIEKISDQYNIVPKYDPLAKKGRFEVEPSGAMWETVSSPAEIERLVRKGLTSYRDNVKIDEDLFAKIVVSREEKARKWIVFLSGINPPGKIVLKLGANQCTMDVDLPKVDSMRFLWERTFRFDGDGERVWLSGGWFKRGESASPGASSGKPGFRVLFVTDQCAWLQVLYREDAPDISRKIWPEMTIGFKQSDSGDVYKAVRFENGKRSPEKRRIKFGEGDSLLLGEGRILSANAVHFRYFSPGSKESEDILVIAATED